MSARPRTAIAIALPVAALATLGGLAVGRSSTMSAGPAPTAQSSATVTSAPAAAPATAAPAATSAPAPTRTSRTSTLAPGPTTAPPAVRPWVADSWNRGYEFGFVWARSARRTASSSPSTGPAC